MCFFKSEEIAVRLSAELKKSRINITQSVKYSDSQPALYYAFMEASSSQIQLFIEDNKVMNSDIVWIMPASEFKNNPVVRTFFDFLQRVSTPSTPAPAP